MNEYRDVQVRGEAMKDEALKIPVGTIIIARVTGNAYRKTRAGWVRVESVAVCRAMVRRRGR